MAVGISDTIRRTARRVLDRLIPPAVILAYHRVAELDSDPQLLAVSPQNFEMQLRTLGQKRKIIPLEELADKIRSGQSVSRLAAITFDDGYCDNLLIAEPILAKLGMPATVFVTSSMVSSKNEFWWDALEALLLLPERLPGKLQIDICGEKFFFELDSPAPPKSWHVLADHDNNKRCKSYLELCVILKQLNSELRENCLKQIAVKCGLDTSARQTHMAMTRDEIARLADSNCLSIGAHTATHSSPASLSTERLSEEMIKPRELLGEITGYEIRTMSYPFGSRKDVDQRVLEATEQSGYSCACVNWPGYVRRNEHLLQLPRVIMRNIGSKFLEHEIASQCYKYL